MTILKDIAAKTVIQSSTRIQNNVVGALCVRDNKILMAKRDINPRKGLWTLPAGFMENAETLQEGAIRETFEETGSKAKIKMAYSMFSLPHINQVHMFFLADLLDDNYGPTFESSDVRLFDIDEILWDEIAFPTVKKTLEYYIEDLKKGDFIFREEDIKLW
jgi:ADP-ribose pyrophosphatase